MSRLKLGVRETLEPLFPLGPPRVAGVAGTSTVKLFRDGTGNDLAMTSAARCDESPVRDGDMA